MLLLLFRSDGNLFAIEASHVTEVIPRVELRRIPHAPESVAGLLNYRGVVLPVIDFSKLIGGNRSRAVLSTRIAVVKWTDSEAGERSVGLIAENVSHLQNVEPSQKRMSAPSMESALYLGAVFQVEEGLVQLILVEKLLNEELKTSLFGPAEELARA